MNTNFIGILLPNTPSYTVGNGYATQLYDAAGAQTIEVQAGASLQLLGAMGANQIRLSGKASNWQVYHDGSTVVLIATDGSRVELAATTDAQTLRFDDGERVLQIDTSNADAPAIKLGTQTLQTQATAVAAIAAPPPDGGSPPTGNDTPTPWTLVASGSIYNNQSYNIQYVLLLSNGTAGGTGMKPIGQYYGTSTKFIPSPDHTSVYFNQGGTLGYSDGTIDGTSVLFDDPNYSFGLFQSPYIFLGDKLFLMGSALLVDGKQKSVSPIHLDYPIDGTSYIIDSSHKVVWFASISAPYGSELARLDYRDPAHLQAELVKDINPGSSSALPSNYSNNLGALLDNGKLLFFADDGVHGTEPWVSDGTAAGTFMLKDFCSYTSSSGYYYPFFSTGTKVFFRVLSDNAEYIGTELGVSDGTTEGTTVLDINPGGSSSYPNLLGVAGGLLYFTATGPDTAGNQSQGLYSSDGVTWTRLADVSSNARLLAWDTQKAFFSVGDATHGEELWVADLASHSFQMVSDILPGSGSGLTNSQAFLAQGKLIFTAYSTASQQKLFVSDGTAQGTLAISGALPSNTHGLPEHVSIGDVLVFVDGNKLQALNISAAQASVDTLSNGGSSPLQADQDQVFWLGGYTHTLYVSDGSSAHTSVLAQGVDKFKVVAENAVFFVQSNATTGISSLWYSDGSQAGTRYIEDLPAGTSIDLSNAVAIQTVGVAPG